MAWTDERIDQLKSLWEKGMTASQIADAVGGVSRNAVIGKAHRLGLQSRPSPVQSPEAGDKARQAPPPKVVALVAAAPPAPSPVPPAIAPNAAPAATGLRQGPVAPSMPPAPPRRIIPAKPDAEMRNKTGLLDLTDKICKWPIGHPGEPDFHFCGQLIKPGFPYCLSHCTIAYQVPRPPRDRGKAPSSWKR